MLASCCRRTVPTNCGRCQPDDQSCLRRGPARFRLTGPRPSYGAARNAGGLCVCAAPASGGLFCAGPAWRRCATSVSDSGCRRSTACRRSSSGSGSVCAVRIVLRWNRASRRGGSTGGRPADSSAVSGWSTLMCAGRGSTTCGRLFGPTRRCADAAARRASNRTDIQADCVGAAFFFVDSMMAVPFWRMTDRSSNYRNSGPSAARCSTAPCASII